MSQPPKNKLIILTISILAYSCTNPTNPTPDDSPCGNVTDIDGNLYHSIRIGTQCWMVENLKTTRYVDGSSISTNLSNALWSTTTTGAYAIYDNNTSNNTKYGKLYNWFTVKSGKLAPDGWHVPTDNDWTILINFLGGESVAGASLKSITLWSNPNSGATNNSGFNGLPAGYRLSGGPFYQDLQVGYFWSSTEKNSVTAYYRYISYDRTSADRAQTNKQAGFSVRCIRD